jgi:hypothetical protein
MARQSELRRAQAHAETGHDELLAALRLLRLLTDPDQQPMTRTLKRKATAETIFQLRAAIKDLEKALRVIWVQP